MQTDHASDDDQRRRADALFFNAGGQAAQVCNNDLLTWRAAVLYNGSRVRCRQTLGNHLAADFAGTTDAHVENDGLAGAGEGRPVKIDAAVFQVPGGKNYGLRVIAVRQRNSGVGGTASGGGYSGNNFKWNAAFEQGFNFLTAATKDEGVAAFQTNDTLAGAGEFNEQEIEFTLRDSVV